MVEIRLEDLVQVASIMATIGGIIGSASALVVDQIRRRVRAHNAEYAAQSAFSRIDNAVCLLQSTVETMVRNENEHNSEIKERISRIEGQLQPWLGD